MIELKPPCPYCGARYAGPYGLPHICKELVFSSMPILRFETFHVRPATARDRAASIRNPLDTPRWPVLDEQAEVRQWELDAVREILFGGSR
jgi:hypothetical protein